MPETERQQIMKQEWKNIVTGALAAATLTSSAFAQEAPKKLWADSLAFKGDLRYRYEAIQDDSKTDESGDTFTRERHRIRARLGAEAKLTDQLKAGLELSTGDADPISGNQTLGDGFAKKPFQLSLAYVDYAFFSEKTHKLNAIAGKMKNPFLAVAEDLVWDSDATPEGLALRGQIGNDAATLMVNAGSFWVQERSADDDLMLYAGQLAAKIHLPKEATLTLGAAVYAFQDIQGQDVIDWEDRNSSFGNSTVDGSVGGDTTNKAWKTEFLPVVPFAKLDLDVAGLPVALFVQQVTNVDADEEDQGFSAGLSLGKAKDPKSWEIGYSYAELEKDAVVGFLTDSDRWGGGTDGNSHRIYGKVQVLKNLQVAATYLTGEKKISDPAKTADYDRLQIDLAVKF
jgi:hypothetical protein